MDRIFFEERQKLAAVWVWVIVLVGLAISYPLLRILYDQLVLGEGGVFTVKKTIWLLCLLAIVHGVVIWLAATHSLEVKIGPSGIYYRSFPTHDAPKLIEKKSIVGYVIREVRLNDFFNSGSELSTRKSETIKFYSITGSTVLELTLPGDQKILLGTESKDSLAWAMKRLLDNPT